MDWVRNTKGIPDGTPFIGIVDDILIESGGGDGNRTRVRTQAVIRFYMLSFGFVLLWNRPKTG